MIHSFDTENAIKYGLHEAIILNNLIFWVNENKANGRNYHEVSEKLYPELTGEYRTWTFNSVKAFQLLFPYLSAKQIRSSLDNLCENGILIKGCYSINGYDRTNWYAFRDEAFAFSDYMQLPYKAKGNAKQGKSITDNKQTDSKHNNKTTTKEKNEVVEVPDFVKKEQEEKRKLAEEYTSGKLDEEQTKESLYNDEKARMSFKRIINQNDILSNISTTEQTFRDCFKALIDENVYNATIKDMFPRTLVKSREHFANFLQKLSSQEPERIKKLLIPK